MFLLPSREVLTIGLQLDTVSGSCSKKPVSTNNQLRRQLIQLGNADRGCFPNMDYRLEDTSAGVLKDNLFGPETAHSSDR
jgi:hypothetical protein